MPDENLVDTYVFDTGHVISAWVIEQEINRLFLESGFCRTFTVIWVIVTVSMSSYVICNRSMGLCYYRYGDKTVSTPLMCVKIQVMDLLKKKKKKKCKKTSSCNVHIEN